MKMGLSPNQLSQPWLKNRRWASGRIRDQSSVFIVFSALFAVLINAIAWLAMLSAWRDHQQGGVTFVFPAILVAVGLLALAWAIRQFMVRIKFGRSVFEL